MFKLLMKGRVSNGKTWLLVGLGVTVAASGFVLARIDRHTIRRSMRPAPRLCKMKEGWLNDTYVIAFDDDESLHVTRCYGIENYLPGHTIVAIVGWDDFIVRSESGDLLRVPTIPLVQKYAEKLPSMLNTSRLIPSPELAGQIKWYVQPLVFGGDPMDPSNIEWVDMQSHQKLVRFWNDRYHEAKRQ